MPPRKATTARKAAAKKAAPKKAAPKRNTTRKTAPKKTVAKKSSRATIPDVPTAGPGERVWLLDVPFRTPAPGAQFVKKWKSYAWVGTELPVELAPFKALPFSYQQWVEDDINDSTGERPVAAPKIPRPEQVSGAAAVVDAARAGKRGFLLADNAGLGKTLIAVMSAKTIAEERGETNILVLVDRPAQITIPHWRYSIASVGDGGFRWLIMSPDQLKKLIARNGRPKYTFGVVIADEAQLYSNDTQRTAAFEKVARFSNAHEPSAVRPVRDGNTGTHAGRPALPGTAFRAAAFRTFGVLVRPGRQAGRVRPSAGQVLREVDVERRGEGITYAAISSARDRAWVDVEQQTALDDSSDRLRGDLFRSTVCRSTSPMPSAPSTRRSGPSTPTKWDWPARVATSRAAVRWFCATDRKRA